MEWLLFTYWLPPEPSRKRVFLWRRLKKLGALSVEGSWLLPKMDALTGQLEEMARTVEEMGGRANLYIATHFTESQELRTIAEFQASREKEYAEVLRECAKARRHMERESQEGQFTFEEVEELEGDVEKIRRWFSQIRERDFWDAPALTEVENVIADVELALAGFVQETYQKLQEGKALGDAPPSLARKEKGD
ncbi:MAG: hypothetical protein HYY01_02030 [Chloroflexi bacterium]|nr:hypothetical protein [Chloroflexota bacterium]